MTAFERVCAAIEFSGPDRLPITGNCMAYDSHGDVIYHFAKIEAAAWWTGGGGCDEWGCVWETVRDGDMGQVRQHVLADLAKFRDGLRPDGADPARYEHLHDEIAQRPDAYHVLCNGTVFFERAHFLRGFEQVLEDLTLTPELFNDFAAWIVEHQLATASFLGEHFRGRIHALRCTDDLGTQHSSIMSPRQFRTAMKPHYARLAERCRENGLHFWLHSCGRIENLLDDLIDAGVQVVNTMQPQLFDLEALGRRFAGRICFEASPDVQRSVPTGDPVVIRDDLATQLACLATPSGGYIGAWLSPDLIKADCDVDQAGLSDLIVQTFRDLDPYVCGS